MRLYRRTGWTYAHATRPPKLVTELCVLRFPRPTFRLSRKAERYWREFSAIARLDACPYKMAGFAQSDLAPLMASKGWRATGAAPRANATRRSEMDEFGLGGGAYRD
jgi:hypothetical protein